jgi:hypothetical protein
LFVTDAVTRKLRRVSFSLPQFALRDEEWQSVTTSGVTLDSSTDVAALNDGSLLIVDRVWVIQLIPDAVGFKPVWQWRSGSRKRLAPNCASLRTARRC